jgi:hypothetical protein
VAVAEDKQTPYCQKLTRKQLKKQIFISLFLNPVFAEGCKNMDFKITLEGEALVNHTFLTERATNDAHCETKCFMDDRCISYNFGRSSSGELYMCELNEADHVMYPDDLVPRSDTVYRMAEVHIIYYQTF